MLDNTRKAGHIVTFYSYKGGVGRSRALANTAYQLARSGYRVLCVDFDLEAPGLLSYFREWLPADVRPEDKLGVMDLLYNYIEYLSLRNSFGTLLDWKELISTVNILQGPESFSLDFLGPGQQTADYGSRVTGFDWKAFYNRWEGGRFIEHLRNQVREAYDYVFLDSRTGISDIGGVCTIQFPTILVIVLTSSPQSLTGLESIIENIQTQHKDLRKKSVFPIIPLPARIDRTEERGEYEQWFRQLSQGNIGKLLAPLQGEDKIETTLQRIMVHYVPWYTYRDELESHLESSDDVGANAWKYKNLTQVIKNAALLCGAETSEAGIVWDKLGEKQNEVSDRLENMLDISPSRSIRLPDILASQLRQFNIVEPTNLEIDRPLE